MWKNLENFSKSIQILVSGSEVWTCNLMITSLVSYPLDHRGKLEKFAVYVCFINKIWKYPFLANEIYNPQTHFGFTNPWSNMPRYWVASSQKVKNGTRTPCTLHSDIAASEMYRRDLNENLEWDRQTCTFREVAFWKSFSIDCVKNVVDRQHSCHWYFLDKLHHLKF